MIPYDLTKIKAFVFDVDGVLSPSTIPLSEDGKLMRMTNIKDGYALHVALKQGFKMAIISGATSPSTQGRYSGLGFNDIYQGVKDKLPVLQEWMEKNELSPENVLYMGDDIPDLKCLRYVGLPCAPHDAVWEVRETVIYVSPFTGGYGCVRDVVGQVLKAHSSTQPD